MNQKPFPSETECDAILALIRSGDIRRAGPACEALVARYPECARGWVLFAELWATVGEFERSIDATERALALEPAALIHKINLARYRAFDGAHREALELADALLPELEDDYLAIDTLANVYSHVGEQEQALALFERGLGLRPDQPTALYNLATSYRFFGRVDEAESLYERLLEIDPDDHEARHSLSVLRRQSAENNHIETLERLEQAAGNWIARCRYAYALGKEYDDLGQDEAAFSAFARGAKEMTRHRPTSIDDACSTLERVGRLLASDALRGGAEGFGSKEPIFLIGLPRTGSTLLERLLGAHSRVFPAGELIHFPKRACRALGARSLAELCEVIQAAPERVDWRGLGHAYIEATRPRTGHTTHFIDKLPANEQWAGLIHRALPRARFILTARDPVDSAYALFRTLFLNGHDWTYDLEQIAQYLNAREVMIQTLKQCLPADRLLEISYEDLVQAPEDHIRRLLAFLDLPWESNCLNPSGDGGAVVTASSGQVREMIHTRSVGKWRAVRHRLQPLLEALN